MGIDATDTDDFKDAVLDLRHANEFTDVENSAIVYVPARMVWQYGWHTRVARGGGRCLGVHDSRRAFRITSHFRPSEANSRPPENQREVACKGEGLSRWVGRGSGRSERRRRTDEQRD